MIDFNAENHEYTLEGIHIPSMSELLELISSDYDIPDFYAERGTAVHSLTEAYDKGMYFEELAGDLIPYMFAYEDFQEEHEVKIESIEEILFNRELLYAGRRDRLWIIDGDKHLTDIKTGGKYRQHIAQLCGYALCDKGKYKLSNLYLNPYIYKLHVWGQEEIDQGCELVEALSLVYWENHRRDRKKVENILGGIK